MRPTELIAVFAPPEYVILHTRRIRQEGASERHLRELEALRE